MMYCFRKPYLGTPCKACFKDTLQFGGGRGGGIAAPAEIPFLGLAEPRLCQTQKKSISWRACALQTSRDCKTETAGFETCLRQQYRAQAEPRGVGGRRCLLGYRRLGRRWQVLQQFPNERLPRFELGT